MTIRIKNLLHRYDAFGANKATLSIEIFALGQGEQALIIGSSASGKSTLLDILAGNLQPTSGEVWFSDHHIYNCPPAHRKKLMTQNLGYMSQPATLSPNLTLIENIDWAMRQTGKFPNNLSYARAKALLSQMNLLNLMDVYPRSLTETQIIKATALKSVAAIPQVILADEPTANLNEEDGYFVLNFLREISHWYNATLLVTTRNPTLASKFENCYYLYQGQLERLGYRKKMVPLKPITKAQKLLTAEVF